MPKVKLPTPTSFNWDLHNLNKNWNKHGIDFRECEQAFKNHHRLFKDIKHSQVENRYHLIGVSNKGRHLHITFTIRDNQVRVISARGMHARERKKYAEKN